MQSPAPLLLLETIVAPNHQPHVICPMCATHSTVLVFSGSWLASAYPPSSHPTLSRECYKSQNPARMMSTVCGTHYDQIHTFKEKE